MSNIIDCRGLDCPGPVLQARAMIEKLNPKKIQVIVDNDDAIENVSRFLDYQGYEVGVDSDGISSTVVGTKTSESRHPKTGATATSSDTVLSMGCPEKSGIQKIVILIGSQEIGKGDPQLGQKLMVNYIKTLKEMGKELWHLIFLNHGVRFAVEDSEVLADLASLEADGTRILVCGTCLTYLGLMDKKAIGQTTNMLDIVTAMQLADKVINL